MPKRWPSMVIMPLLLGAGVFVACSSALSKSLNFETQNQAVDAVPGQDVVLKLQNLYRQIAKSVTPAVVSIQVESEETVQNPFNDFFRDPFFRQFFGEEGQGMPKEYKRRLQALGSGFIVTQDGYIFSNYHVVKDATKIQVILADNRKFKARVIGTDPETDIALLKINAEHLPVAAVGDSGQLQVGDLVIAIGNPFGLTGTYTSGIISFVGRPGMMSGFQHFIQTDAPVNPGNSGGPLVNIHGQVIGINTAIQTQSGGYEGISFAVPINTAKSIANQLISGGRIERGYIGVSITELDSSARKVFGVPDDEGVLVSKVDKGGPADQAGLKRGDIVMQVNGNVIKTPDDLQVAVGTQKPGSTVALEVIRNRARLALRVKLTERPGKLATEAPGEGNEPGNPSGESYDFQGATFVAASQDTLEQNNTQYGVEVADVSPDSPLAGILPRGSLVIAINDTEIRDLKALKAFAEKNRNARSLVFAIVQNGFLVYRGVEK